VEHFAHLVSLPREAPTTPGGTDEFDPKQLLKDLEAERDRLQERLPAVEAAEKRQGDARVRSYTLPKAKDLDLLLRYDPANDKKLHKTIDLLRRVQADRRAAEAAAGAVGGDQPAAE